MFIACAYELPLGPNWLNSASMNTSDNSFAELTVSIWGSLLEWKKAFTSKLLVVKILESPLSISAITSMTI